MNSWETLIKYGNIHRFAVYVHLNALIQKVVSTLFHMGSRIRMWVWNATAVEQKHRNISEFMFLRPVLCVACQDGIQGELAATRSSCGCRVRPK